MSLKKKELLSHATTWIHLDDIMVSEISQWSKSKFCMIPLIKNISQVINLTEMKNRIGAYQGLGGGVREEVGSCSVGIVSVTQDLGVLGSVVQQCVCD